MEDNSKHPEPIASPTDNGKKKKSAVIQAVATSAQSTEASVPEDKVTASKKCYTTMQTLTFAKMSPLPSKALDTTSTRKKCPRNQNPTSNPPNLKILDAKIARTSLKPPTHDTTAAGKPYAYKKQVKSTKKERPHMYAGVKL